MSKPPTETRRQAAPGFRDDAYPALRQLRSDLALSLRLAIEAREWSIPEAAAALHIGQPRVELLKAEKWQSFSLEMLVSLAVRCGLSPQIVLTDPMRVIPLRQDARRKEQGQG
jgi:predicted XRE-type DNA-binding protein